MSEELFECSYCARYSQNLYTGTKEGKRFFGTHQEVVEHADMHPIGDPLDYPVRVNKKGK